MKTYAEAVDIISQTVQQSKTVKIPIEKSAHYILSQDIISTISVAPYRNSAMDGFAVAYADIKQIPFSLPIHAVTYAGDSDQYSYKPNTAIKIMTGAPVPEGYDTVIQVEHTTFTDNKVTFHKEIKKNQNVRLPGEDIKEGDTILKAGARINPLYIGILASIGMTEVEVYKKPNILVLSTGNELVEPGTTLQFGQLYNSNSYTVRSMLAPFCDSITVDSIVLDERENVISALSQDYDIIITSGGVSAGDKDFIPEIAEQCGWVKKLHKASIKPGKPIFFAKRDNQYLFGLPGNPLSTAVTCACFVIPAIKKIIGIKNYRIPTTPASLSKNSIIKSGRTLIWPGKIFSEDSSLVASFANKKSSAALSALLQTDGLIFQYTSNDKPTKIEITYWDEILYI
ncbi:MAG TPA: molybdopterin molybdenumtransferase MoeA [candidate division Zixibacteria bacterium]|nr:molybdopterin molybdenumtransferase MoeA [candidate division Zixibacteria bacterium]